MVFCNMVKKHSLKLVSSHNPYFNRWFSAIQTLINITNSNDGVTILILIDGFLQFGIVHKKVNCNPSHNPYFNRWFSAII